MFSSPQVMSGETSQPARRPVRSVSATERFFAVARVRNGESKASVARSIGVAESTFRGWVKEADKIWGAARSTSTPDSDVHSPGLPTGAHGVDNNHPSSEHEGSVGPMKRRKLDCQSLGSSNNSSDVPKIDNHQFTAATPTTSAVTGTKRRSTTYLTPPAHRSRSTIKAHLDAILYKYHDGVSVKRDLETEEKLQDGDNHSPSVSSSEDAIRHMQAARSWLRTCSEPWITQYQVTKLSHLLDSVINSAMKSTVRAPKQSRK